MCKCEICCGENGCGKMLVIRVIRAVKKAWQLIWISISGCKSTKVGIFVRGEDLCDIDSKRYDRDA